MAVDQGSYCSLESENNQNIPGMAVLLSLRHHRYKPTSPHGGPDKVPFLPLMFRHRMSKNCKWPKIQITGVYMFAADRIH